jgi:DeoR family transcriptional regulator, aga operon transcriptional repressor
MTAGERAPQRDRIAFILDALTKEGHVDIDELADALKVSTATIRRDLDNLALKQLLIRTRGGAVTNSSTYDLPLQYNALRHADEKRLIARATADRIKPGSVIGLNAGTTTTEVARALAVRPDLERRDGETTLTIVTNAINIAHELTVRAQFQLIVVGGVVRPASYELIGPIAERALIDLSLDDVILTANGLSARGGASCNNLGEAAIGRHMIARANHVTLILDSSKFGVSSLAKMCPLEAIDTVIADEGALGHRETTDALQQAGVELVIARDSAPHDAPLPERGDHH